MRLRAYDEVDMRILAQLQRDGRITFQSLSQIIGLSARQCLERVHRLERGGVITGYTARVDLTGLINPVIVIAHVLVKPGRDTDAFEEQMYRAPEVIECLQVSGAFDYIVKVVSTSFNDYRQLAEAWINDTSMQVERIETDVVMRLAKNDETYPVAIVEALSERDTQGALERSVPC